jgi:hypothetical protein
MEFLAAAITVVLGVSAIIGAAIKGFRWLQSRNQKVSHSSRTQENNECKIKLAPAVHDIPAVMNGGTFQGQFANFQIRFGSETDLEFVDAALFHETKMIRCESRIAKLEGGKAWNSFLFASSELPFIPDEILKLKIRVCDHSGHCCELIHELQMKQFPHPEYTGRQSGRWEIHPTGIFKIRCSENMKF